MKYRLWAVLLALGCGVNAGCAYSHRTGQFPVRNSATVMGEWEPICRGYAERCLLDQKSPEFFSSAACDQWNKTCGPNAGKQ